MFVEGFCVSGGALMVDSQRQAWSQISAFTGNEGWGLLLRECPVLSRMRVDIRRRAYLSDYKTTRPMNWESNHSEEPYNE